MRLDHNADYLDASAEGRLTLQRCTVCGHVPNFPRVGCPRCLGELEWFDSTGRGEVVSFTVIHRPHDRERFAAHVPIVMALIQLDERNEMIATLVGDDRFDVAIGDAVVVAAKGGWSELPQFRRAAEPA